MSRLHRSVPAAVISTAAANLPAWKETSGRAQPRNEMPPGCGSETGKYPAISDTDHPGHKERGRSLDSRASGTRLPGRAGPSARRQLPFAYRSAAGMDARQTGVSDSMSSAPPFGTAHRLEKFQPRFFLVLLADSFCNQVLIHALPPDPESKIADCFCMIQDIGFGVRE